MAALFRAGNFLQFPGYISCHLSSCLSYGRFKEKERFLILVCGECHGFPLSCPTYLYCLFVRCRHLTDCQSLCPWESPQLTLKSWRNWDIVVGAGPLLQVVVLGHGFRILCLWLKPDGNATRILHSFPSWGSLVCTVQVSLP